MVAGSGLLGIGKGEHMEPHWLTYDEIRALPDDTEGSYNPDPVRKYGDFYYYWDETRANCYGPFATESDCRFSLDEYADTL